MGSVCGCTGRPRVVNPFGGSGRTRSSVLSHLVVVVHALKLALASLGGIRVSADLRLQIGVTPLVRGWRRSPTTLLANASPWGGSLVQSTVHATVGRQRPKKEVAEVVVCSLWLSTSMWPFHHLLAVDLIYR